MAGHEYESSLDVVSACGKGIEMTTDRSVPVKKGILLVAFGIRTPQAQAAYQLVERKVRTAFPDIRKRQTALSFLIMN